MKKIMLSCLFSVLSLFAFSLASAQLYEEIANLIGLPEYESRAVAANGNYAYVLGRDGSLYQYDISDIFSISTSTDKSPISPPLSVNNGVGLIHYEDLLYAYGSGISIIDIQNPNSPSFKNTVGSNGSVKNAIISKEYLILCEEDIVEVFSLSKPESPNKVSDLFIGGSLYAAAVYKDYLYISTLVGSYSDGNYYLSVIDFSNPEKISLKKSIKFNRLASHMRVIGNNLIISNYARAELWSLNDPLNPSSLDSVSTHGRVCAQIDNDIIFNDKIYRVADSSFELLQVITPSGRCADGYPYGSSVIYGQGKYVLFLANSIDVHVLRSKPFVSTTTTTSTSTTTTSTTSTTTTTTSTTTSTTSSTSTTTTLLLSPSVTTESATANASSATVRGTINPNGSVTTYYFEYGTTSTYDDFTPYRTLESGTTEISLDEYIDGLLSNTTYHYRLVASNGSGKMRYGDDKTFTTSFPEQITDSKAIIVAGGGPYAENNIWEEVEKVAASAYNTLISQGYTKDLVYYLSPNTIHDVDGDGDPEVDADATSVNLAYAIQSWSQDVSQLILYMVGHGGIGEFKIGNTEKVSVQDLDAWLDNAQEGFVEEVVFLYDACHSGSFFSVLSPPPERQRVFAASAESDQDALISGEGLLSFSYLFWSCIRNGDTFYDSFVSAKNALSIAFSERQDSKLEVNWDGKVYDKDDKALALKVKVGLELKSGSEPPSIGSVYSSPKQIRVGDSTVIYARDVEALEGLSNVWAVITPPSTSSIPEGPVVDLPILDLSGGEGSYQGAYGGFNSPGTYNVAVFAQDQKGYLSMPVKTTVTVTDDESCLMVAAGLGINVPCAEYDGTHYGFLLDFYPNPDDPSGFYWKLVMASLTKGTGPDCNSIGPDLRMPMDCVSYNDTQYGFVLRFYPNPYDPSGLYWVMDKSTLIVK